MSTFLPLTIVGVVYGCVYAITATGLVVTYTTSGVFNFAHGAMGMIGAFAYWQLSVGWGLPAPLALLLVLFVIAPALGAVVERVLVRPMSDASLGITLVVTVGLLLTLLGAANALWKPSVPRVLPPFFQNTQYALPGVNVSAHQVIVVGVSIVVAIGLRLFFTRTRTGATMRAVVDDPGLVALAGAAPHRSSQLSWALGSALAALAGILLAPLVTLNILTLTLLVIDGYAAAVVGRLRSLPLTVVGGLVLGLSESYSTGYLTGDLPNLLRPALPMFLLFLAVVFLRHDRLRSGRLLGGWTPRTVGLAESLRGAIAFVAVAGAADWLLPGAAVQHVGQAIAMGFILLSLVLLTGYGGQVSLCQMTFVGVGAFVFGKAAPGGSLTGALLAVLLTGLLGVVVAIPVLRLRGLYLALATLAFASGMDTLFFVHSLGAGGSLDVARLRLGVSFAGDHAYFMLLAVMFAAAAVGLLAIRRSPFGRRLAAINDSPAACATLGISITGTKLAVFGLAAAMAGFGGVLYGGETGIVGSADFQMLNSLVALLILALGGIATVSGAFLGAFAFAMFPVIQQHVPSLGQASFLLTGLLAVSIGRNPHGMVGQLAMLADRLRSRPSALALPATATWPAAEVVVDRPAAREQVVSS